MSKISFPQIEEDILESWEKNNIFQKTLKKESKKGDFIFFEGPPTANGKPAIHHVLARAFKDIIPRFKTMQGFRVIRKGGWDTHGLPVELQVEKSLKISGKPQIETLKKTPFESIKYFNELCKKSVWQYKEDWEKLTRRMGYWVDMENPYITYDNTYIESVWWVLSQAWNKKDSKNRPVLYQGHKVVPFCTRCGTALSSHEMAQGYHTVKDTSVYVKFKLLDEKNTFILSWTTTPWTLPGNVALAVGENMTYVKVKQGNEHYIVSKNRLGILKDEYEVEDEFKGKKLLGKKYEPLFIVDQIESEKENGVKAHEVVAASFVTDEDGTGVVHTAVMYGEDDYQLGCEQNLPQVHTVSEEGLFNINIEALEEMGYGAKNHPFVKNKEVDEMIIGFLKKKNTFYKTQEYEHEYPHCWRCDTPLIYYARNSWFIRMSSLRDDLKKNNASINWVPEHVKEGRFGEWLTGIKDWSLSRDRYWGTPLPIWKCESCDNFQFLDGKKDIEEALQSIQQKLQKQKFPIDYHRPYIDQVTFACSACGKIARRVPEVIDVWFDSGAMPFAQWHYPFENKEMIDGGKQYPADYISEAIDQTRGWFYTLLAISTFLGKGASYKNVVSLAHILDKKGKKMSKSKGNIVDPWEVMNTHGVDALRFHLYAMSKPGEPKRFDVRDVESVVKQRFLILWNVLTFYKMFAGGEVEGKVGTHIMDQWLGSTLNNLVVQATKNLEEYHITEAVRSIGDFITELSTWYIRRSRERFKSSDEKTKKEALETLRYALDTLSKLLAPFTPFIADALYKELGNTKESVHLENWPKSKKIDEMVLSDMKKVRELVEKGLSQRESSGIKLRQPLSRATITENLPKELQDILAGELNVESVVIAEGQEKIILDTKITPELEAKGMLRELTRQVNGLRKKKKLRIQDVVEVQYQTEDRQLIKIINNYKDQLHKNTISSEWKQEANEGEELKINNASIKISFN